MAKETRTGRPRPADVLVIFGITGDLAKVMTFHSLYRLEQRGLLDCPIVGRGGRPLDRSTTCASTPARRSRPPGSRSTRRSSTGWRDRMSYLPGDFADAATYQQLRRGARRRRQYPSSTWRSRRSCSAPWSQGLAEAGPDARRAGWWSRSRSATTWRRPGRSPTTCTSTSTSRSSTGSTTSSGRWAWRSCSTSGSPTRCSSRCGTGNYVESVQITMAESFGVEDRGHFYDPVGALRDVVVNHLMQVLAAGAMEPPAGSDPDTIKNQQVALWQAVGDGGPGALRARPVRRLPRHRRRGRGLRHRDLRRAAAGDRQLALGRRAVLHPHRQAAAGHPDRVPARLLRRAAAVSLAGGSGAPARPGPDRGAARPVDRRPDPPRRQARPTGRGARAGPPRPRLRRARAATGRRRTRCCCTPP